MSHDLHSEYEGERDRPNHVWPASLHVVFARDMVGTRVSHAEHRGPLRVQRAFYPEGPEVPHLYLLHPPGGLAGGDHLSITVEAGPGAAALCTTPAAGKCYRSNDRLARQVQRLSVGAGAALEWLPQENIVFDGAEVWLETRVELNEGAAFVGWDVLCLGRPASGERFERGRCRQRFELFHRAGDTIVPICIERACYEGGGSILHGRFGLGGAPAVGTLLVAPASPKLLELSRVLRPRGSEDLVSSTLLGPAGEVLCCRFIGQSAAEAREHLARIWSALRPELLGRAAVWPRIWST